jgi:endonuclease/exonuclease/phosphatase family metal-dependent hydrolase
MTSFLKYFALISICLTIACSRVHHPRILTYNIRLDTPADGVNQWPNRKEKVAELLRKADPSIFGVQEAKHNQMIDLQTLMPEYAWSGVGRDDGKTGGEYSAIFYKKAWLELTDSGTFWLSETPDVPGSKSWDAAITRVCSWVKLKGKGVGKEFFVFNTHFDHIGETARLESMKLIAKKVKEIANNYDYVLMGDFNCEPSSPPYAVAQDKSLWNLTDAWATDPANAKEKPCTFTGFKVEGAECKRIDYIFLSPSFKVKNCHTIPTNDGIYYPSDHLPVVAELTF